MSSLNISEIFYSIQGETSMVGKPSVFIRLAGCNLECSWCDTLYSREKGKKKKIDWLLDRVAEYKCPNVVITGGEPMMQADVVKLIKKLTEKGYKVVLETNGSIDISGLPKEVKIVMDIKTPSSGEAEKMNFSNISKLNKSDEIKFVISNQQDFVWSCEVLKKHKTRASELLFSPVKGKVSFETISGWVKDTVPHARIQPNLQRMFSIQ
jgi:7-carboxy-7-deazaguanine synthase